MSVPNHITIKMPLSVPNKVTCIKAIRMLTGLGLKESKDISDAGGVLHELAVFSPMGSRDFEDNCRILRNEGVEVNGSVHMILQDLRDLGAQALKQGEDELANEILQLVLAEKLRRNITFDRQ
jgi:hypothetical protein